MHRLFFVLWFLAKNATNSLSTRVAWDLLHNFSMPQVVKIPDAKAAVEKEWNKLETVPLWQLKKRSRAKKKVMKRHQRGTKDKWRSPLFYIDGHMTSQECGVRTEVSNV